MKNQSNQPDRTVYRKWVGVLLGLFLSGSAHVLAGKYRQGVMWHVMLFISFSFGLFLLTVPGVVSYCVGCLLMLVWFVLWIWMLMHSRLPVPKMGLRGWLLFVLAMVFIHTIEAMCSTGLFSQYSVATHSMQPIISEGRVMVQRFSYHFRDPQRGEVVTFRADGLVDGISEGRIWMKRVVGIPGDRVRIEPPEVWINNEPLKVPEEFLISYEESTSLGQYLLPQQGITPWLPVWLKTSEDEILLQADEYFLLSDNSAVGLDSRYFGPVKRGRIEGKVTRMSWPVNRINDPITW